jgi:hypothetical protein
MATRRKTPRVTKKTTTRARPAGRIAKAKSRSQEESINAVSDDDLVLLGLDGESLFWVKKEVYESTRLPKDLTPQMSILVGQGVVLADVGMDTLPGIGSACFLVNLANIRHREAKTKLQKK